LPPSDAELARAPAAFRAAVRVARENWRAGVVTLVLPSGAEIRIQGAAPGPHGRLVIRDYHFVSRALASADIGLAEGFMAGEWDTPDLSALLGALSVNFDHLARLVDGNPFMRAVNFLAHAFHGNSRRGASSPASACSTRAWPSGRTSG